MMSNKILITIRYMQQEDVKDVAEIEKQCFSEPWSEKAFADTVSDDNYLYIVAECDGRTVGYVGGIMSAPDTDITNIAVKEQYRRMGIGQELMRQFAGILASKDIHNIFLEVRESNEPAINLYREQGFEQVGMRKNFYAKPTENALIMVKKLQ